MEIGYARVSRGDSQDLDPQLRALTDAGCAMIYQEEASGGQGDRPELARAIGVLKPGDVFVVWKLDRLSRSLRDLLFTLEAITAAGAGFRSVTEAIDTTTAPGRLMTQMLGAFAEFERAMIRERTMNGLTHARKAGRLLGRRPSLTAPQRAEIIAKAESGQGSPAQLANLFRVSRSTVQRVLRDYRARQDAVK
ncbi:recombinase family protein [uncultured Sphingomonas sp.]|uniref:recombinase family protein n=1 Tax=uncultured Sphingomonas sp. TaxID=158754 RepID=UPI0035CC3394